MAIDPRTPGAGLSDWFTQLARLPSPEKLFTELQRLNNNLEKMQPDMDKIAKAVDGLYLNDIRLLTQTLQGMKINEMLLALSQTNTNINRLTEHLWPKK